MSMIGKTLGQFECTTLLGKGGMGEVYQAKDQKLGRDVAIKVLPEEFAKDAERVARFQREAKLLASLNHPNIASIYGLEESNSTHFLVLELIEGDTLADRLKRGAIPVEESLKLALQMAEALETSLANEGWSAVSALSKAPTWGGGSWMSYTSALFGVLVEQQSKYNAMKVKYTVLEYPNIGRYFSSQGYEYVWVVPINRELPETRQVIDDRFYGPDQWVTIETLDYDGPLFGWGPSVPDQFTLGFIQNFVAEQEQPTFLVYLTQNSHYPWTPLPPVLDDWREEGLMRGLDLNAG